MDSVAENLPKVHPRALCSGPLTGADVEPVGVVGSELLLGAGLDDVDPGGDLELTRTLKVGRVGRDEVLGAVDVMRSCGEGDNSEKRGVTRAENRR